jgi:hypothetical protein
MQNYISCVDVCKFQLSRFQLKSEDEMSAMKLRKQKEAEEEEQQRAEKREEARRRREEVRRGADEKMERSANARVDEGYAVPNGEL